MCSSISILPLQIIPLKYITLVPALFQILESFLISNSWYSLELSRRFSIISSIVANLRSKLRLNRPRGGILDRQDRRKLTKFGQIWKFSLLVYSITMVWCIMSCCQKVTRSIKNITLKFCAVYVKQYKKKTTTGIADKNSHGYYTTIMRQLTRHCLLVISCQ